MQKTINKYTGLPKKELRVVYSKLKREHTRSENRVASHTLDMLDCEPTKGEIKALQGLEDASEQLQGELDTVGMMIAGRF